MVSYFDDFFLFESGAWLGAWADFQSIFVFEQTGRLLYCSSTFYFFHGINIVLNNFHAERAIMLMLSSRNLGKSTLNESCDLYNLFIVKIVLQYT